MRKSNVTYFTLVRLLTTVHPFVTFERGLKSEGLVTLVALERSFSRVFSNVISRPLM